MPKRQSYEKQTGSSRPFDLTDREKAVDDLVNDGKNREQIADALDIKVGTVSNMLVKIREKKNAKTWTQVRDHVTGKY